MQRKFRLQSTRCGESRITELQLSGECSKIYEGAFPTEAKLCGSQWEGADHRNEFGICAEIVLESSSQKLIEITIKFPS